MKEKIEQLIKKYEDKKLEEFRLMHINNNPSYSWKNFQLLVTSYNLIIQDLKQLIK